jgi:hypothetical protein
VSVLHKIFCEGIFAVRLVFSRVTYRPVAKKRSDFFINEKYQHRRYASHEVLQVGPQLSYKYCTYESQRISWMFTLRACGL